MRKLARSEVGGGILLLAAAVLAIAWANSPLAASYEALSAARFGPDALHLDLSIAEWATDGLLAIFFFVVGVELKQEFVVGQLRDVRRAAVPVLAAVGGMIVPAAIYLGIVGGFGAAADLRGWAIPTATDIAFALSVLAIFGRGLPGALRTFLLTLAVVDDLLAILVIAIAYTASIDGLWLALAILAIIAFGVLVRMRWARWWILLPTAILAWALMHASGVHATIAAVAVGLTVPARPLRRETTSRTERYEHAVRPWSTLLALPVFAFFAAGVPLIADAGEPSGGDDALPVLLGVGIGLVGGKLVGVLGTTALVTRLTRLELPAGLRLRDLLPVGLLTGMGFTVSLLIAELSFDDPVVTDAAKLAVFAGTIVSAVLGAALLRWDARRAAAR